MNAPACVACTYACVASGNQALVLPIVQKCNVLKFINDKNDNSKYYVRENFCPLLSQKMEPRQVLNNNLDYKDVSHSIPERKMST